MENNKPIVNLISKPENMLRTIYTACRTCYSADLPINIYENTTDEEKMLKLVERVISSGHYSTIEHIQVSFAISNVSRACTHQLVRHRHMSFSQKSQRYVKEKGLFDYITPPTIARNEQLAEKYNKFMENVSSVFSNLKLRASWGLTGNSETDAYASQGALGNYTLVFSDSSLCTRAQYEIRTMVKMMCDELVKSEPWLEKYLTPKCEKLGYCDEDKCCGRKIPKAEFFKK